MEENEIRFIANQLSYPTGDAGIDVGNKMNELNKFITSKTIEKLSSKKGEFIVEIGPGNGLLSRDVLKSIGESGRYLGLERSETMAPTALKNLAGYDAEVDVICGDCLEIDLEPMTVDGIMAVNLIYFLDDLQPFLSRVASWLKKEGRIVFGVRSEKVLNNAPFTQYGFNIRSTEEIEHSMRSAGFDAVESVVYDEGMAPFGEMMFPIDSVIISGKKS